MQYLYLLFAAFQLLSLVMLHFAAGDTAKYRYKLQKRHPECKPRGVWDFITFRYYLRCPKANSITTFLYKVNLCGIGFFVFLIGIAVLFMKVSIDLSRHLTGMLQYLLFFPILVSCGNVVLSIINAEQKLGLKYYIRYWVLADIGASIIAALVYFLLKICKAV